MVTLAQIDDLHDRLGRADSLADYLRGLAALRVVRCESFVTDGHSEYFTADGQQLDSPAHHAVLEVAATSDREAFLEHLRQHADGETSYVQMSQGLAGAGVEKWVADIAAMTMTYHDRSGVALLVDQVG